MKLYKTTVVIWSDFNPITSELSELVREAEHGDAAYCARMDTQVIEKPEADPDWRFGMEQSFSTATKK